MASLLPLLVLLAGCPKAEVPAHLRLSEPEQAVELPPPTTVEGLVERLLSGDPLARAQRPVSTDQVDLPDDLARFLQDPPAEVEQLQQLEATHRGTLIVPLVRGQRLARAERLLSAELDLDQQRQVLALLSPLEVDPSEVASLDRAPLAWLGEDDLRRRALDSADPWVLAGWLDGPDIPLGAVSSALDQPQYDRLRESPLGRLVQARASGASAPADLQALQRVTALALERAAADRDREQAAWKARRAELIEELGHPAPLRALLEAVHLQHTANASDDRSAGAALLAIEAERWVQDCATPPCRGLDRTDGIAAAARWHPEIAALAAQWQVVALKEAMDRVEVTQDTALAGDAMVDLVDALLGSGLQPPSSLLERERPTPGTWLALTRCLGAEESTSWEGAKRALARHVADRAAEALVHATGPAREPLERIRRRGSQD